VSALQQRTIVFGPTTTGSAAAAGVFTIAVGSLYRFNQIRVLASATSGTLTLTCAQQVASHASIFDITSGGLTISSGRGHTFDVYGDVGRITLTTDSATQIRAVVLGVPW